MIRDRKAQTLFMNFDEVLVYGGRPSDIDMFYVIPNWWEGARNFLLLAEIKHESGHFEDSQRHLYETLIDGYEHGGCCFYLTHNKRWQDGATEVNVADCNVEEYYYKGKWNKPLKPLSLNEAIPQILKHYASIF